jgi:O-antigen/teichoic acid export membrane protein
MLRELFADLSKYLPSMVVPAIVGMIALPTLTHLFTPDMYGNYTIAMSTVSILSIISTGWLNNSLARFFPLYKKRSEISTFRGTVLKLSIISIISTLLCCVITIYFVKHRVSFGLYSFLGIGIILFAMNSFFTLFIAMLRAERKASWYSIFVVWHSISGFCIAIILIIFFDFSIEGMLWGMTISILLSLPILLKAVFENTSLTAGRVLSPISLEMAKYGAPATAIGLLTWVLSIGDRYILEIFRGSLEVGIYSASYAISEKTVLFVVSLFFLAANPIAFRVWEMKGLKQSQNIVENLATYYMLLAAPMVIGVSVLSDPIVNILTGADYHSGYVIIPIVAVGGFFLGVANIFSLGLGFHKRTDILMVCYLFGGLLNIVLNLLFVPKYGFVIAAWTTFASYVCMCLFVILFSRSYFRWRFPFLSLAKIGGASVIMGITILIVLKTTSFSRVVDLILNGCLGVVVYGGLVYAFRVVSLKPDSV